MAITSTLYLSTDQVINPPIQKSNLASVTWIVDWDNIFRGHTNGLCKVTCNMISKKGTGSSDTWDGSVGIMTASFSSPYILSQNGCPICPLNRNQYIEVSGSSASYVFYYQANTTKNSSPSVITVPSGKSNFSIQMLDTQGNYIKNFPEYNVFFHFEWL